MRNLFSFLGDLRSDVLYAVVQLLVVLDIALGVVLAFPLWGHVRAWCAAARRHRALSAALFFSLFFLLPSLLLTRTCVLLRVGGIPVGMVESAPVLQRAVSDLQAQAASLDGKAYALPFSIEQTVCRGTSNQLCSVQQLRQTLTALAPDLAPLAVISVDGTRAGVCSSVSQAQTLLDGVKAQYGTAGDRNLQFVQAVRVDTVTAPARLASEPRTLFHTLFQTLDVTAQRQVTYTETIPFDTITRKNEAEDQTYRVTVQRGQSGQALVRAIVSTIDGEEHGRTELTRTVLQSALPEVIEVGTRPSGIGTGSLLPPLSVCTVSSRFQWRNGRMHSGIDLAVAEETPVYAADNGKVILAGNLDDGYGNYIILDHQNGMKTLYAHNAELLVSEGDFVSRGQTIARSGNTGNSTGPHLHFEVMLDNIKVDPEGYINLK